MIPVHRISYWLYDNFYRGKVEGKVHPITWHDEEAEQTISTVHLTSALDGNGPLTSFGRLSPVDDPVTM